VRELHVELALGNDERRAVEAVEDVELHRDTTLNRR